MAAISVLLADDHAVLRAGLRMLINAQPDMKVIGEAAGCGEALEKVTLLKPDVLTLDLTMPGGGGIKIIERLRQDCPRTRVLVLTMHDDPAYLRAVMAAGGAGYVVKTVADAQLLSAIRGVRQGRIVVDVNLPAAAPATSAGSDYAAGSPRATGFTALSAREREVFMLFAQGYTNQQIADRLFLSVKTIETYRARIADKLGLRTRADLVRYALEVGLLAPEAAHLETRAG